MKKALLFVIAVLVVGYIFFGDEDNSSQETLYTPQAETGNLFTGNNYNANNYYIPSGNSTSFSTKTEMQCSICNGKGRKKCSSCHGEGSLYKTQWAPDFGGGGDTSYKIATKCAACSGTGEMMCIYCGGDGTL